MAKPKTKTIFTCQNCGAQRPRWEGKCTDCGAWNSLVEEFQQQATKTRGWSIHSPSSSVTLDKKLDVIQLHRHNTGYEELNRVLGGGLAQGSFVLLGGAPGIGKSTLLLQMAGGLAKNQCRVLYMSGEESISQTANRAHRLGIRSELIEIASESNLQTILEQTKNKKPDVLVVDSIQTVYLPDLEAAPGSVSQVRECAGHLMGLAKQENITVILIGHVTKDGNIAGPKVLEHMVDCVLSFDGDLSYNYRLLRALKNRFGAALELGVFQMSGIGLKEVSNPSEMFLEERGEQLVGSAIFSSMEGTRPLLCEIQALSVYSPMAMPRRTSIGIENNRLHMLAAVLEKHLEIKLNHDDLYINVVGGLKLVEPASDLAVAAAILSTHYNKEMDPKTVFFGELGLTGEVRGVSFSENRLKEGDKLGFTHFVIPYSNKKHIADLSLSKNKKITFVKNIKDLNRII